MTGQKGSCGCGCVPMHKMEQKSSCGCGCSPEPKDVKAVDSDRTKQEEKKKD